jgi:hypothetical protein
MTSVPQLKSGTIEGCVVMKQLLLISTALLALSSSAQAQQKVYAFALGLGSISCGDWLATASSKTNGQNWLLGYWSGINVISPTNHIVGHTTDAQSIILAVESVCAGDPAQRLSDATAIIYNRLYRKNR